MRKLKESVPLLRQLLKGLNRNRKNEFGKADHFSSIALNTKKRQLDRFSARIDSNANQHAFREFMINQLSAIPIPPRGNFPCDELKQLDFVNFRS